MVLWDHEVNLSAGHVPQTVRESCLQDPAPAFLGSVTETQREHKCQREALKDAADSKPQPKPTRSKEINHII